MICQGVSKNKANHAVCCFIRIGYQIVMQLLEGSNTIVIIRINHGERFMNYVFTAQNGMGRSPWLYTVGRYLIPLRQTRIHLLKYVFHLDMLRNLISNRFLEIFFNRFLYNKNNLVEACTNCIKCRHFQNNFSVWSNRINLLQSSVTAAHTGRQYN